ncbi:hypothetical protein BHM03_00028172 [Ensete ventricosum]|uniref:Uncharacterized protein n=1 Tax=Ensete ventricosum TaxID=4639 RepID=A0A445MHS2_ENSVE|nr:hypothetical protein BHM03_00028172 [Ensete ventricosum]
MGGCGRCGCGRGKKIRGDNWRRLWQQGRMAAAKAAAAKKEAASVVGDGCGCGCGGRSWAALDPAVATAVTLLCGSGLRS